MTKDQKIIEIRTSAKVKLENLKAKMKTAIARAAQTHADILAGMTDKCENERFNEIERFKAEKSNIEAGFYQGKAALFAETETACAVAEDDPEPEKEQPQPQPQENDQPTQWLNGEQWSCAVVARRILNKLPKLNSPKESFYIELSPSYFGGCGLSLRYINTIDKASGVTSCELLAKYEPEEQAAKVDLWLKEVEVQMARAKEIVDEEREEADNE